MAALFAPAIPGWLALRVCFPGFREGPCDIVIGFLLGQSFFTLAMFIATFAGIAFERLSLGLLLAVPTVAFGWLYRSRERGGGRVRETRPWVMTPCREFGVVELLLSGGLLYVFVMVMASIAITSIYDIPGTCIWGLKAKVFFLEKTVSSDVFLDESMRSAQRSYPLGFPLLLTWLYVFLGETDDYVVRWVPVTLLAMLVLYLLSHLRREGLSPRRSLFFVLMLVLTTTWAAICTNLYAESLLLLDGVAAFTILRAYVEDPGRKDCLRLGFVLLSGSVWIKHEGLVMYVVGVLSVATLTWLIGPRADSRSTTKDWVWAVLPGLLVALPWTLFTLGYGLAPQDFVRNPAQALNWDRLGYAWQAALMFGKEMFLDFAGSGIPGPLFLAGLLLVRVGPEARHRLRFYVWSSLAMVLVFSLIFIFTDQELSWHLRTVKRLSLLPTMLLWLCVVEFDRQSTMPPRAASRVPARA